MSLLIGVVVFWQSEEYNNIFSAQTTATPTHIFTSEQTEVGITLLADAHNAFSCPDTPVIQVSVPISSSPRFWIYEYTGNEKQNAGALPSFDGKFFISGGELAASPQYAHLNTLLKFKSGKTYYVMSAIDLEFSCSTGLKIANVAPPTVSISSISPSSGPLGTVVTITGENFHPTWNAVSWSYSPAGLSVYPTPPVGWVRDRGLENIHATNNGTTLTLSLYVGGTTCYFPLARKSCKIRQQEGLAPPEPPSFPWKLEISVITPNGTSNTVSFLATDYHLSNTCGNGILERGEGCDDENTTPGDGCSATCGHEPGYKCTENPSTCREDTVFITSITPTSGDVGTTVTLHGTGFTPTGNLINFSGAQGESAGALKNINATSNGTSITFDMPSHTDRCIFTGGQLVCSYPSSSRSLNPYGGYNISVSNINGTSDRVHFAFPSPPTDSLDSPPPS